MSELVRLNFEDWTNHPFETQWTNMWLSFILCGITVLIYLLLGLKVVLTSRRLWVLSIICLLTIS
jgi:hypothetical protein